MCKKMDGFKYRKAIRTFIKAFLAMTCMCAGIAIIAPRIAELQDVVKCIIGGTIGCMIYVLVLLLLKEKLMMQIIPKIKRGHWGQAP